jgi:hypothetical protein
VVVQAWANPFLSREVNHELARAVTAPDGRFTLAPLDAAPYQLVALVDGREAARAEGVVPGTGEVVLRVPASGKLRGLVRDDTGAPVVSFSVVIARPSPRGPAAWTTATRYDARGAFEIDDVPAGPYVVTVVSQGRAPSDDQKVEVPATPALPDLLTFVLHPGRKLSGRVIDRVTRAPLAGARVEVQGGGALSAEQPLSTDARTDGEGRFELAGMPPARVALTVTAEGHHGRVLGGLMMSADRDLGPLEVDLAPTRPDEKPRLEFVGIGAVLAGKDDAIEIGQVMVGAGASQAGLRAGDLITAVDGRPVSELGLSGAVNQIRGAEGTVVVLKVKRAGTGQIEDVAVTRRPVRIPEGG